MDIKNIKNIGIALIAGAILAGSASDLLGEENSSKEEMPVPGVNAVWQEMQARASAEEKFMAEAKARRERVGKTVEAGQEKYKELYDNTLPPQ